MATYTRKQYRVRKHSGAPYGTLVTIPARMTTNASGVVAESDATVALATADVVKLTLIPAGTKLIDIVFYLSDAFTASATAAIGFAYEDGVDSTAVPQDADFFAAALDLNSVAVSRKVNAAPPVTLPKDAWLTLTLAGANLAAAGVLDVQVIGETVGVA